MKKFLLIGTALLSIAPYAGAMNSDQKDSKINLSPRENITISITPPPSINNNNATGPLSPPLYAPSFPVLCPPFSSPYAPTPLYPIPNQMTPEEKEKAEALSKRWKDEIVSAVFNNTPFETFKGSLSEFAEAYKSYNQYSREALFLNTQTLNLKTREVIDEIHKKLENITNELKNKTTIEMDNIVKEDWEVIRKISLLSKYSFCLDKKDLDKKEIKKDLTSLINLASFINQPEMKPICDWFIRNGVYAVLRDMSQFYSDQVFYSLYDDPTVLWGKDEFPWKNIIESSLYSSKNGFDPLAIAVLWPHLVEGSRIVEIIPKHIKPAIFSDLVKGLIDYAIDVEIPKDVEIAKFYPEIDSSSIFLFIYTCINSLGQDYNLGEVSPRSFDGKESIINMIQRKMQEIQSNEQDETLLQKRIKTLTQINREILRIINSI